MEKEIEKTIQTEKTENDTKKEPKGNFLKRSEIGNQITKELEKTKAELINLKKAFVKSIAEKYEINSDIDLDKLNYESLDNLESSLLKYCEKDNIKYKAPESKIEIDKSIENENLKKVYLF